MGDHHTETLTANFKTGCPSGLPFDLVWNQTGTMNEPVNPEWLWQCYYIGEPGQKNPDPNHYCNNFDFSILTGGLLTGPNCMSSTPPPSDLDEPDGFNGFASTVSRICRSDVGGFSGHINLNHLQPVEYTGTGTFESKSVGVDQDGDINVALDPDPSSMQFGQTHTAPGAVADRSTLETEFHSTETIDRFGDPWWRSFTAWVDKFPDESQHTDPMHINGHTVVELGQFGIDTIHTFAELHPVYVFAIREQTDDWVRQHPDDDVWAVFARVNGDEGGCSHKNWWVPSPSDRVSIELPPPTTLATVSDVTALDNGLEETPGATWSQGTDPEGRAVLSFDIPPNFQGLGALA